MLITLEGPDSSGKSTQANILKNKLIKDGYKAETFHFPRYESTIGCLIKEILDGNKTLSFEAMQMLYVADQLSFQEEINNLLKNDCIVILDRYDLSTLAYYIAKTGVSLEEGIRDVYKKWQCKLRRPDMTFVFDSKHKITERREECTLDILEKDNVIASSINNTYLEIADTLSLILSRSVEIVNANDTIENISNEIYKNIKKYL